MRDAILSACPGDTITFNIPTSDPGFSGGVYTILLTTNELTIGNSLTMDGPGQDALLISAMPPTLSYRVVNVTVASPGVATLAGLTIANGSADNEKGGGVCNSGTGTINLTNTVRDNSPHGDGTSGPPGGGAGVANTTTGTINVTNSSIRNNFAGPHTNGGGILKQSGTVNIANSTLSNNFPQAIFNTSNGRLNFINSLRSQRSQPILLARLIPRAITLSA